MPCLVPLDLLGRLLPAVSASLGPSMFSRPQKTVLPAQQARRARELHTVTPVGPGQPPGSQDVNAPALAPQVGSSCSACSSPAPWDFPWGSVHPPTVAAGVTCLRYQLPSFPVACPTPHLCPSHLPDRLFAPALSFLGLFLDSVPLSRCHDHPLTHHWSFPREQLFCCPRPRGEENQKPSSLGTHCGQGVKRQGPPPLPLTCYSLR